jgi:hypothetical protein
MRYTTLEDRSPSCLVSTHDRISGTHTVMCGFDWRQLSMNSSKRSDRTPTVKRDKPRPLIDQRNSAVPSS